MTYDQSLVLYSPSAAPKAPLTTSRSLSLSRVFSAQTGTAIVTELLYRILWKILHRIFNTFQQFASNRIDHLSQYFEARAQAREQQRLESVSAMAEENKARSLGIVEEVAKLEEERGGKQWGPPCPMGGGKGAGGGWRAQGEVQNFGPPAWVKKAARAMRRENMLEERDVWIQAHGE